MSVFFSPAILGPKWPRQFYGRLGFFWFSQLRNPNAHKNPPFFGGGGGGGVLGSFIGGGRKCEFYFYGRGDFSRNFFSPTICQK